MSCSGCCAPPVWASRWCWRKLKLLLTTQPGSLVSPQIVRWSREHIARLEVDNVGPAGHHAPEDQPDAIGRAIAKWLARYRLTDPRKATP